MNQDHPDFSPQTDQDKVRKRLLFVPCESKAHMAAWIKTYLNINLPDATVSEESNSNPMDMLWEIYDRLRRNDIIGFSRAMTYANRGGFKTLGVSILEVMVVLHLGRNVAHMSATLEQSAASQEYVKNFFNIPIIQEFVTAQAEKHVRVVRYQHKVTKDCISRGEYARLPYSDRRHYKRGENYIKIVACTMRGANSKHVEFFVVDEVDVVAPQDVKAYRQAQNIPDPRDGMLPMTLMVSTRKSRTGLVQQEIDAGAKTGLQLRHWNAIDTAAPCEPARHKPELPKQVYYINDEEVRHISAEQHGTMNAIEAKKWYPVEGYAGCGGCRLFAACKGRLATHQTSKSPMLKPLEDVIAKFQSAPTPDFITTEYLCRKPDTSGLIYPRLNAEKHMIDAEQIASLMTDEPMPHIKDKGALLTFMRNKGVQFYSGMDFGFTHNFAVVTFGVWGQYCFVVDCFAAAGLELDDKVEACEYMKPTFNNPQIFGDMAYPADIKTFRRKGFRMKEWEIEGGKGAGSVKAGIEIIRALLWSGRNQIRMFFLKGDPGVDFLFKRLSVYKFKIDAVGEFTNEPDKTNDDECDALRYGIMNIFGTKGAIKGGTATVMPGDQTQPRIQSNAPGQQQAWMQNVIAGALGGESSPLTAPTSAPKTQQIVKKGRFIWDG